MFNNVALDAVTGLVLVYLLYSLLVTLVGEYLATKLGLRARMLRTAIERMLNDGYYTAGGKIRAPRFWGFWSRTFLRAPGAFRDSFAGRFYRYPSIKFLSKVSHQQKLPFSMTKPAYISAEYFADTLINMLRDKSRGNTGTGRICYALDYNTQHIQPETLRIFRNIFTNANGDPALFKTGLVKWYNETMARCNGWYKRKLKIMLFLLGLLIASIFNVDSIHIAHILASDKEARAQMVNMGIRLAKDSNKYQGLTVNKKDSIRGKAVVDSGLAHISRDINSANLIMGIGWNYDTLREDLSVHLRPDDKSLYPLAAARSAGFNGLQQLIHQGQAHLASKKNGLDTLRQLQKLDSAELDVALNRPAATSKEPGQDPDTLRRRLLYLQARTGQLPREIKADSLTVLRYQQEARSLATPFHTLGFTGVSAISAPQKDKKGAYIQIDGQRTAYWYEKVILYLSNTWHHLPGLLITALALSMGAPFWFNLLDKLVSIRSSGKNPDNGKKATGAGPEEESSEMDIAPAGAAVTAATPVPGTPAAVIAFNAFAAQLKDEPGITSIWLNNHDTSFSVRVSDPRMIQHLLDQYGKTFTADGKTRYAIGYNTSPANQVHASVIGGEIGNISGASGAGTLGAYLTHRETGGIYLLSCWHVMKDDYHYDKPPAADAVSIIDASVAGKKQVIGKVVDGGLSTNYDIGIAQNTLPSFAPSNGAGSYHIRKQHRALTDFDEAVSTPVLILGSQCGIVSAKIYRIRVNAALPYADGTNRMLSDLFSLTVTNPDNTVGKAPTAEGDSGAVVIDPSDYTPLGMIIGGNGTFSYAMKFSNTFDSKEPYYGYSFFIPKPQTT